MKNLSKTYPKITALIFGACLFSSANVAASKNYTANYDGSAVVKVKNATVYSEGDLAQILAPVALYPDSLLAHLLVAASYPLDLVQVYRFDQDNPNVSIDDKMEYAQDMGWDPSLIALLAFPNLLAQMHDDLDWTISLGNAFVQNESFVLATVQTLRREAHAANNLRSLQNLNVSYVDRQIIIEPKHRTRIYLPVYNPLTVYGDWRWRHHQPHFWGFPRHVSVRKPIGIHWDRGIDITFDLFFGAMHWSNKQVVFPHHKNSHRHRSTHKIVSHKTATPYKDRKSHKASDRIIHDRIKPKHYSNIEHRGNATHQREYNKAPKRQLVHKQKNHNNDKVHKKQNSNHKQKHDAKRELRFKERQSIQKGHRQNFKDRAKTEHKPF